MRYFLEDNKGSFTIWIQLDVTRDNYNQNQTKSLSPFKVGKLICKKYKNILYICSKTRSRVEVNFKDHLEANKLLNDSDIKGNNLIAYIPGFRLSRKGLIKSIDEDISEEEIGYFGRGYFERGHWITIQGFKSKEIKQKK